MRNEYDDKLWNEWFEYKDTNPKDWFDAGWKDPYLAFEWYNAKWKDPKEAYKWYHSGFKCPEESFYLAFVREFSDPLKARDKRSYEIGTYRYQCDLSSDKFRKKGVEFTYKWWTHIIERQFGRKPDESKQHNNNYEDDDE